MCDLPVKATHEDVLTPTLPRGGAAHDVIGCLLPLLLLLMPLALHHMPPLLHQLPLLPLLFLAPHPTGTAAPVMPLALPKP